MVSAGKQRALGHGAWRELRMGEAIHGRGKHAFRTARTRLFAEHDDQAGHREREGVNMDGQSFDRRRGSLQIAPSVSGERRMLLSVVIPCMNEEEMLRQ